MSHPILAGWEIDIQPSKTSTITVNPLQVSRENVEDERCGYTTSVPQVAASYRKRTTSVPRGYHKCTAIVPQLYRNCTAILSWGYHKPALRHQTIFSWMRTQYLHQQYHVHCAYRLLVLHEHQRWRDFYMSRCLRWIAVRGWYSYISYPSNTDRILSIESLAVFRRKLCRSHVYITAAWPMPREFIDSLWIIIKLFFYISTQQTFNIEY